MILREMPRAGRERFLRAASEAIWGCRLSYSRIKTPVDPPAMSEFNPVGPPNVPWVHDWYAHVLFASRLLEAGQALLDTSPDDRLKEAIEVFKRHWDRLRPLRNGLQHPTSRGVNWKALWPMYDRLTYQRPGRDPEWDFSVDDLHEPVEKLYAAVEAATR